MSINLEQPSIMSFFKRLFSGQGMEPRDAVRPLYLQIIEKAREPHWYLEGGVPDNLDGRFEMVTAILILVLLRLEHQPDQSQNSVYLTEIFVNDMDGQLREIGIGDMIVGKHIGRMMASLGGRLGAYRAGLADHAQLDEALIRNLFRGEAPAPAGLAHVHRHILTIQATLESQDADAVLAGGATW